MKTTGILLLLFCVSAGAQTKDVVKEVWEKVSESYIDMPARKADWEKARGEYVGKAYKTTEQEHTAIREMLATLHNSRLLWLSAKDLETILSQFSKPPPKLGLAYLSFEFLPGQKKVITALANSPAAQAGVRSGDVLTSVNGTGVSAMSPGEVVRLLDQAGEKTAELVVRRDGKPVKIEVKPEVEPLKFVSLALTHDDSKVTAEIVLREFTMLAVKEFQSSLDHAEMQHASNYTIDLRNNPGGLLDAVRAIAAKFISDEEFMCKQNAAGLKSCEKAIAAQVIAAPVTILVNEGTASAAEIFAAGFQLANAAR